MNVTSRRKALQILGGFGGLGVFALFGGGCSGAEGNGGSGTDGNGSGKDASTGGDDPSAGDSSVMNDSAADSAMATDAGAASDSASTFTDAGLDAGGFAIGSGSFLDGKEYGDPFSSGVGTTCTVYGSATEGPCHSNTYLRKEITDGLVGLPTRFEMMVVDASCNPVPGVIVEIWYASPAGTYSKAAEAIDAGTEYGGSLSDLNVSFCTGNDSDATASKWLRAYQVADANGRVTFDGIFPGWYRGRTTHVHFIVTVGGKQSVTSQFGFDEALTTAVYTKHGSYSARGDKDTTNASDNVLGPLGVSTSIMSWAQQSDGALVCWKAITIK